MAMFDNLFAQQAPGGGNADLIKYLMGQNQSAGQSLAQVIPYLPYALNQGKYTKKADQLAAASTDLNNPMYQQIKGQFQQEGQNSLAQSIAELSRQNRKLQANGRSPLLDTERGGESIFRNLIQGYQQNQGQAGEKALGQINNAYQMNATQGMLNQKQGLQKTDVFGNVGGALAKLFGL